ncbi:hypothetical protein HWV62_28218 [Athelia sp. TMB]|nr:hypothetical protein HWV62_28218 [Athelia sp. TMB]
MSSAGIVVGSISGGLAILGIVTAIAFLQLKRSDEKRLGRRPKDLSTGQVSEPEAYAEAVHTLEQLKEVVAGKCSRLLALPIDGLLDVANACSTNDQDDGKLAGAIKALDVFVDSALVSWGELVTSANSDSQGPISIEQVGGDLVALGSLLENLSASTKHILLQLQSSVETPHADIAGSIQSAVQEFSALDRPGIEDSIAVWASRELERHGGPEQCSSRTILAQSLATTSSTPDMNLALPSSNSEEHGDLNGMEVESALGASAYYRHNTGGSIDDLHESIAHFKTALNLCPLGHSNRSMLLNNLASALGTRFGRVGQIADLEKTISYFHDTLELCPPGHPVRPGTLNNLAAALSTRFRHLGHITDLKQAISCHHDALELCPPGHPDRPTSLGNLAGALATRFGHLGQIADLEEAIRYLHSALELLPPGHPNHFSFLNNLASALSTRFRILGQTTDLEQAISHLHNALVLYPPEHPNRSSSLNNLASALSTRFRQLGQITDLEQAIDYLRSAVELRPLGHPNRSSSLNSLANALSTRFDQLGQIADLQQAISHYCGALELRPPGHPDRSGTLNNLASALSTRFNQLGQIADLEQAISNYNDAIELCPPGHPDRSISLIDIASALITRFDQLGQIADLDQAISYLRDTLELCPLGHPIRSGSLNNLAAALNTRFGQLGQIADLEQAISNLHSALELRPPGHPDRSSSLNNLASALITRFRQLSQLADLEKAIEYYQGALELCPPGHTVRSNSLNNLANALSTRFGQLGRIVDLEQAISYHHDTLELCPPGHPDRSMSLNNLAAALCTRFEQLGQIADLEQAIDYYHGALELCPPGHAIRSNSLNNLAHALSTRFGRLGQIADLEQAISYLHGALELYPPGHPDRSTSLDNLASALRVRFEKLNTTDDLHEAISLLQSGAREVTDTPKHRYTCASRLIALLERHSQPLLSDAYDMALSLLQLVLAVYPDVELRREALDADRSSPTLAMSAAAHAIQQKQPEKAVEMLEQGRGLLYSNMRGYREPVEAVRLVNATLADRFKVTSDQLEAIAISLQHRSKKSSSENSNESAAVSDARWARQRQLSIERDEVIQQIRLLPGFDHFLKAVPFSELQHAAAEGPVIIVNVAEQRSDIIILHKGNTPIVLSVPADPENSQSAYLTFFDLSKQLFEGRTQVGFSRLLEKVILKKLAELLVTPVLEKLESMGVPKKSRIWWCPTSALCALPIHAAGKLPIKFVSSYTPTLSALISARKPEDQHPSTTPNANQIDPSLLAVVYAGHPPENDGEPDERLLTVFEECEIIEKAAQTSQARRVVRADPTREATLEELPHHRWVHFACHGRLNISQPFQSAFELEGDPLSLSDLVQARLPNADLAFLAACDSATSGGTTTTPDELLHLAAAVQFCGVRSVVGTLWPMADVDGPRVAEVFYEHMFQGNDSRKSAVALHKVVTAMRRKTGPWKNIMDEGEPLQRWANYIHIGA